MDSTCPNCETWVDPSTPNRIDDSIQCPKCGCKGYLEIGWDDPEAPSEPKTKET